MPPPSDRTRSGGHEARVGLARPGEETNVCEDEPSRIDDSPRHLQDELLKIVARTHSTVVMGTHDG